MPPSKTPPKASLAVIVPDQLWSVNHVIRMMPGVHLPARMVVIRLGETELALHSPVPLTDALAAQLAALGEVKVLIAPNNYHHLYLEQAAARYPAAELWAAPGLSAKRSEMSFEHLLGPAATPSWADRLKPVFLAGAPKMDETAFVHHATRTLIVTDSFFNLGSFKSGLLSSTMFRLTGSWNKPGQSRIWRSIVEDKAAMRASTEALLSEDFDRLVMAHGDVLETGGREAYRSGAAWLLKQAG